MAPGAAEDGPYALAGVTVLEPATGLAAGYCGRLLAMLGADVIKIESAARPDIARTAGPFPDDVPHPERSGLHRFLHAQKRSVALDVATASGQDVLRRLARTADVLIDDGVLGAPPDVAATYEEL